MTRHDWPSIGLKVAGIFFAVTGIVSLGNFVVSLMVAGAMMGGPGVTVVVTNLVQPIVYLVAAYYLILRTPLCVDWCDPESKGAAPTDAAVAR